MPRIIDRGLSQSLHRVLQPRLHTNVVSVRRQSNISAVPITRVWPTPNHPTICAFPIELSRIDRSHACLSYDDCSMQCIWI